MLLLARALEPQFGLRKGQRINEVRLPAVRPSKGGIDQTKVYSALWGFFALRALIQLAIQRPT